MRHLAFKVNILLEISNALISQFPTSLDDLNYRLKIGAKSKKDPHIRVGGRTWESVMKAKMMISEVLDTSTSTRVTMKMDVSYTDHSHIIGKGGNTIKRVMAETNCHIHFPDSNRANPDEKSNQVISPSPTVLA